MGSFFFVKETGGCRQPGKIDSPLNKKLQEVKWGEFRLGDLFEFKGIKQAKSQGNIPTDENGIVYVVQSMSNNMVSRKVNRQYLIDIHEAPVEGNCIVLGVTLPAISYQPNEFGASQVITARAPFLNNKNSLFFVNIINKHMYQFSYQNKPGIEIYKNLNIQLPITSTGEIDSAFMEKFISELEEERISELSAYLEVTGLKDYTLTPEEDESIKDFKEMEWGEFEIGELFDFLTSKKRFDANKVNILENGNYPYIVRTSLNNGTKGYLNENEEYLNSGNTISFGQDTATIFYQKEPYFTGDKIKIVKAKDDLFNAKNALYFLTSMNKSFQVYSWGSSSFNVDILSKEKMFLPLQNNSLNYPFMETFISAIQKLVIKDVVLYADKKINATKTITTKP